ncbi:unnamed protein product, partial [marine sediment metagenome]
PLKIKDKPKLITSRGQRLNKFDHTDQSNISKVFARRIVPISKKVNPLKILFAFIFLHLDFINLPIDQLTN